MSPCSADSDVFCADLMWYWHELPALCGLRSMTGAQIDALAADLVDDAVEPSTGGEYSDGQIEAFTRGRGIWRYLTQCRWKHQSLLEAFYEERRHRREFPRDEVVEAHRAYYSARKRIRMEELLRQKAFEQGPEARFSIQELSVASGCPVTTLQRLVKNAGVGSLVSCENGNRFFVTKREIDKIRADNEW